MRRMRRYAWQPWLLVALAVFMAGCMSATNETLGENIDDTTITSAVKAKLAADKLATLTKVSVDTVKGTVYLNGIVDSSEMKARAEEVARQVQGVRSVVNNLQVKSG